MSIRTIAATYSHRTQPNPCAECHQWKS